ncbi:MAG: VCBS repeat-containing protein [Deltaproteobacteria bacterium]|nr:VCBS repeat-containing protein [Deltaproteobacteria bacterium]
MFADARHVNAVAVGDLNGDRKLDAVFATSDEPQVSRVCIGDGSGGFACAPVNGEVLGSATSAAVALGDVNGDGKLDAVFGHTAGQPNRVCLGNGAGNFSGCANLSGDTTPTNGVALGDVNGDGKLDVLLARSLATKLVCLGNGDGTFAPCSNVESEMADTYSVALGDVNNDGKLDAVFANLQGSPPAATFYNRVCLGDGAGHFSCSAIAAESDRFASVALGDVDNDGNLDAVFANNNQLPNRVCLGDGAGHFACSNVGAYTHGSTTVVLADLNADGHLDAVFGTEPTPTEPAKICLGIGNGTFTCSDVAATTTMARGVAAGKLAW